MIFHRTGFRVFVSWTSVFIIPLSILLNIVFKSKWREQIVRFFCIIRKQIVKPSICINSGSKRTNTPIV